MLSESRHLRLSFQSIASTGTGVCAQELERLTRRLAAPKRKSARNAARTRQIGNERQKGYGYAVEQSTISQINIADRDRLAYRLTRSRMPSALAKRSCAKWLEERRSDA